ERAFAGTQTEDDEIQVPVKEFSNRDFAYWTVTIERPLQLRFECTEERIAVVAEHKTLGKVEGLKEALESFGETLYLNREAFMAALGKHLVGKGLSLKTPQRKTLWQTIGVHDEAADY